MPPAASSPAARQRAPAQATNLTVRLALVGVSLVLLVVAAVMLGLPAVPCLMALALMSWCAWRPTDGLMALPALLPFVDWTSRTGPALVDGSDLLLLGAAAGWLFSTARVPWPGRPALRQRRTWFVLAVLAFSLLSVVKALVPLPSGDAGAMLTPTHALNPLRAASYVVALALMALPLGLLLRHQPHRCLEQFTRGLALSVIGIGLVVLEQRGVLTLLMQDAGLKAAVDAALTTEPSVPGPFAEARFAAWATATWLVMALPFVLFGAVRGAHTVDGEGERWTRQDWLLSVLALTAGLYAAVNTMNGAAVLVLPLMAVFMVPLNAARAYGDRRFPLGAAAVLGVSLLVATVAVAWSFDKGGYVALFAGVAASFVAFATARLAALRSAMLAGAVALVVTAALGFGWVAAFEASRWQQGGPPGLVSSLLFAAALVVASLASGNSARQLLRWRAGAVLLVSLSLVWALAVPAMSSGRLAGAISDWRIDAGSRYETTLTALKLPGSGLLDRAIGEGVGSYPDLRFWWNFGERRATTARIAQTTAQEATASEVAPARYLRLGIGPHSLVQRLRLPGGAQAGEGEVRLRATVRSPDGASSLSVALCPAAIGVVPTVGCEPQELMPESGNWEELEVTFPASIRSGFGGAFLLLSHGGGEGVIDVGNVSLADTRNADVLRNGDFAGRAAPWYLVARSNAAAWSARSLYAQLFVEQGIVGSVLVIVLLLFALVRQLKQLGEGATLAVAIAPAIMGVLALGFFVTVSDVARTAWLLGLLALAALYAPSRGRPEPALPQQEPPPPRSGTRTSGETTLAGAALAGATVGTASEVDDATTRSQFDLRR